MEMFSFIRDHFFHAAPILFVGVIALAIVVERFFALYLYYPMGHVEEFFNKISGLVMAAKIEEANGLSRQCDLISDSLLLAAYHKIAVGAPRKPLGEVAPLVRRPAEIDTFGEYPQVSVRSFGKGTFHNPPLQGSEITWQKP